MAFKIKNNNDYAQEGTLPEFNQMGLYLLRLDRRQDERDTALNIGELVSFYRATLSVLGNCIPKFKENNLEYLELKNRILEIGKHIKNLNLQNTELRVKNGLQFEEQLWEQNILLNELMFKAGMIYPIKTKKEHNENIINFIDKFIDEKVIKDKLKEVENAD